MCSCGSSEVRLAVPGHRSNNFLNLDDLRRPVRELTGRGVGISFVTEVITFTCEDNRMATLLLSVMGAFADVARALIGERQRDGIALAKARDMYKGRRPALSPHQRQELARRVAEGEPIAALAREFGIARQTAHAHLGALDGSPSAS